MNGLAFFWASVTVWLGSWVVAALLFTYQAWTWLRSAWWPRITLGDGLWVLRVPLPMTDWAGVQKLIDGALAWDLAGSLFGFGFVAPIILLMVGTRLPD